ncbi:hypothetical protein [uncultured Sphaerochaeta sp.]|uniref:hypothetical protein n=1 Tax=uncultured Sphaerochaeta sp. TaxID=886478 RepID=UPI00260ACE52|nr:hypothetical protein [uncultured Sphaerochaeta sp.]
MSITVSYEMANKLEEAGFDHPTFLCWVDDVGRPEDLPVLEIWDHSIDMEENFPVMPDAIPAPTFSELLDYIPQLKKFGQNREPGLLTIWRDTITKNKEVHVVGYRRTGEVNLNFWWIYCEGDTIADAAAELWIEINN